MYILVLRLFSDVELECFATWKDGSTHNLVARLYSNRKTKDEDRYRCFIYQQTSNNSWNLAQSADAACAGLISVTEAAKTFKMKQSEYFSRCLPLDTWYKLAEALGN